MRRILGRSVRAACSRLCDATSTGTTALDSTRTTRQEAPVHALAPLLLGPQVFVPVAHDHRGPLPERERDLVRRAPPDDELYPAFPQSLLDVLEPLQQKRVVPLVRLRVIVGEAEEDQEGLAELVRPLHGVLQGVVVLGALGLLHPVQDVLAVPHVRLV